MNRSPAPLLEAAAAGDAEAWSQLVERYNRLVWSVARGFRLSLADTADVCQTTWLRLIENLDRIQDPDHLAGWLATTARREALRLIRKQQREQPVEDGGWSEIADSDLENPPEDRIMGEASVIELRNLIAMLPGQTRVVMELVAEGLTVAEIAAKMRTSEASVRAHRSRARRVLTSRFDGK